MSLRLKLRLISLLQNHRRLSTFIPNSNSNAPPNGKAEFRAALFRLRTEKNPERILDICYSASLTLKSQIARIAYSKAIYLNYFDGIRAFLEESMARPDIKSERSVSHFIVLYGQAGMLNDARRTFEEMHEMGLVRTVKTLNSLLFTCVLPKDYKEMMRVYMEFPKIYGIVPNLDTYNTVIKGLCESGDSSSCYSILAEMNRKGIRADATTFGSMVAGFYAEEKFEDVGKVLEMMKEHEISSGISIYNIRIQMLCKMKRSKDAKALFEGILSRGYKPKNLTYSHLILGFCKEGDLEDAKGLFERMMKDGIQPESDCCSHWCTFYVKVRTLRLN